ncbi:hypothetical protein JYU12_02740 [bacterium AH-315-K03]|nr:hypothetical protein [bacterium AH-315-K03]
MTDSVYYFDPDGDACEFCQSMAGVYVDETPIRPHDNCDCEIIEYTIGEGEDNCEVEYRDIGVSEGYGSHDVSFDYDCDSDSRVISTIPISTHLDANSALVQAAEDNGWTPELEIDQLDFEVPAHTEGTINATSEHYDATIYAEKYVVCTIEGVEYEKHIDSEEGRYFCVYDYAYTLDSSPC